MRLHGITGELDGHVNVLVDLCVSGAPVYLDGETLLALQKPREALWMAIALEIDFSYF